MLKIKNLALFIASMFALISLASCGIQKTENSPKEENKQTETVKTSQTEEQKTDVSSKETTTDTPKKGKFVVSYEKTALTGDILPVIEQIKKAGYVEAVLDNIASNISLKNDIPVIFKDCGYANAFWTEETQDITYCYEMIQAYNKDYSTLSMENKGILLWAKKEDIIAGTTLFILTHEVAHGLVNIYHLPITGREENAVDQFATLLLTVWDRKDATWEERMARYALYGALFFKELATKPSDLSRSVFADEHGLGQQRFYDVTCLVFGSDPEFYSKNLTKGLATIEKQLIDPNIMNDEKKKNELLKNSDKDNILPYERAFKCPAEFQMAHDSWDYLLDTFAQ